MSKIRVLLVSVALGSSQAALPVEDARLGFHLVDFTWLESLVQSVNFDEEGPPAMTQLQAVAPKPYIGYGTTAGTFTDRFAISSGGTRNPDCFPGVNKGKVADASACSALCSSSETGVFSVSKNSTFLTCKCCSMGWVYTSGSVAGVSMYAANASSVGLSVWPMAAREFNNQEDGWDCQPSSAWKDTAKPYSAPACSALCPGSDFVLGQQDFNCKCCTAGYRSIFGSGTNARGMYVYSDSMGVINPASTEDRESLFSPKSQKDITPVLQKDGDCKQSSGWLGVQTPAGCKAKCPLSPAFVIGPDGNCKCCNAGWEGGGTSNGFNIYPGATYVPVNTTDKRLATSCSTPVTGLCTDFDCQPSGGWLGRSFNWQCAAKCQGSPAFVIAPDNNCKCCNAGWKPKQEWSWWTGNQQKDFKIYDQSK